jgi:hypothetical protein
MPCYLFTYHAYGTWMPDRKQGYVKRKRGILPCDPREAAAYRAVMNESVAELDSQVQITAIDSIVDSQVKQSFATHFVATDTTHVHALVSWRDDRTWLHLRSIIKGSNSSRLKCDCGDRTWLSEGASRKRVKDRSHFDYLITKYLPSHRGWKWAPERGKSL